MKDDGVRIDSDFLFIVGICDEINLENKIILEIKCPETARHFLTIN